MTTIEAIFAAWLFLLTLAAIGLFAGWIDSRDAIRRARCAIEDLIDWREGHRAMSRRRSCDDSPARMVGADRGRDDDGDAA